MYVLDLFAFLGESRAWGGVGGGGVCGPWGGGAGGGLGGVNTSSYFHYIING